MKRILLTCLILFLTANISLPQQKKSTQKSSISPPPLMTVLGSFIVIRFLFELQSLAGAPTHAKSPQDAIADLDTFLTNKPSQDMVREHKLVRTYRDEIVKLLQNLELIGDEFSEFIYPEDGIPLRFALASNKLILLLGVIKTNVVYNTLRLPTRSRGARIISSVAIPALSKIHDAFSGSAVKSYGVIVVYRSRDFLDDSFLATTAEMLAVVVNSDVCEKFLNGLITEDELVSKSDIYLCDSEMSENFRKIKVSLE